MAETPGSRALSPTPILLAQPKQAPCGLRARHPGLPPGSAPRQPRRSLPALPRRALTSVPPRRPPAVPARPRPRRTQAAAPWLSGAAGTERREARGTALPPCPCHPPPLSRQREGRQAAPGSGWGGGEGKEVGPSGSQAAPGAGAPPAPVRPSPPAPPSPGVALAEGGFEQRRDVRALGLQIRRASLRHLLRPAAAAAAGAGTRRAACWE